MVRMPLIDLSLYSLCRAGDKMRCGCEARPYMLSKKIIMEGGDDTAPEMPDQIVLCLNCSEMRTARGIVVPGPG